MSDLRQNIQVAWSAIIRIMLAVTPDSLTEGLGTSRNGAGQLTIESVPGKMDGRKRLKGSGKSQGLKTEKILYRCSSEKRMQLIAPADRLSVGKAAKVTFIQTMDLALDALEREENARNGMGYEPSTSRIE